MRLGFDTAARLLETVVLVFESGDEMVIHAMPARRKYLAASPSARSKWAEIGLDRAYLSHVKVPQNDDGAAADSPLGLLQRGRGQGWTGASATDLLACLAHDPRWDHQVETRDDYYATLALRLHVTVPVIASISRTDGNRSILRDVVEAMARRGADEATTVLAEMENDDGALITGAPQRHLPPVRVDFPSWSAPVEELLKADWRTAFPKAIVQRLVSSTDPHELDTLRKASVDSDGPGWRLALHVLSLRGDLSPLALVEQALTQNNSGAKRAATFRYITHLPAMVSTGLAREWLPHRDGRGLAAGAVLAHHAALSDETLLRDALTDAADYYTISNLVMALGRLPAAGPFPELDQVYLESAYSYARARAVDAMAVTDPEFSEKYALECLWDCEPSVRVHGAERAPLDSAVAQRLDELAHDRYQDDEVRDTATAQLLKRTGA